MSSCKDEQMWAFQGGDNNVLQFQGTFAKLRNATISFDMCVRMSVCLFVRPSIRMKQLSPHWTDFREEFRKFRANSLFIKI